MNKSTVQSGLICPECGSIFKIWRQANNQREMYHKKFLYCTTCNKITNHIELKNIDIYIASLNFKTKEELTKEEQEIYQLIKK